ncbi:uncharacterized protein LOC143211431 [Lasioglossum baleicum]|uniref:uncharacterized protein LOC143211431 n=1 Tax=Lasioglossum baleicum TaxID=434251 RepID=UPI003FCD6A09
MQNYLTARYRQVHDKIKDVRISGLRSKLPKISQNMRMVSLLDHVPTAFMVSKLSTVGSKIAQFPYSHWRKSLNIKYWTIGLIVSLPIFYQFQALANSASLKAPRTKDSSIGTGRTEGNVAE